MTTRDYGTIEQALMQLGFTPQQADEWVRDRRKGDRDNILPSLDEKRDRIEINDYLISSWTANHSYFSILFDNLINYPIEKGDHITVTKNEQTLFCGYVEEVGRYGFRLVSSDKIPIIELKITKVHNSDESL